MGGGGGGGGGVIPFNMSELAPFMPSVFNGPYNPQGANANEQMIEAKYPWITPPAGQFEGAQPGQFAGANTGGSGGGFGAPNAKPPNPPIPATAAPPPSNITSNFNPMQAAGGMPNSMNPTSLQQILAVLSGQGAGPIGSGPNALWQQNPTPTAPPMPPSPKGILQAAPAGG